MKEQNTWKYKELVFYCLFIFIMIIPIFGKYHRKDLSSISRPYAKTEYTHIEPQPVPLGKNLSFSSLDLQIIQELNKRRDDCGLQGLMFSQSLASAAAIRAEELREVFSHTRPDGRDWYTVNENVCFGENLAYGYDTAEDVVDAWIASPAHKELLLDNEYQTCGIGHYEENGIIYVACEFGY